MVRVAWSAAVALFLSACTLLVDTTGLVREVVPTDGGGGGGAMDATDATTTTTDGVADVVSASDIDTSSCLEPGAWTVMDHCYFLLSRTTQPLAKSACVAAGGHLVTVTSAAEHNAIVEHVSNDAWIGLEAAPGTNNEADFSWITGEPKTVNYWADPDEATGCVVFDSSGDDWADRACNESWSPLCERP